MKTRRRLSLDRIVLAVALAWTLGAIFFSPWGGLISRLMGRGIIFLEILIISETMFVVGLAMLAGGIRKAIISPEGLFAIGLLTILASLRLWWIDGLGWWSCVPAVLGSLEVFFGPGGGVRAKFQRLWALRQQLKALLTQARQSWLCRLGFVINTIGAFITGIVLVVGPLLIFPWQPAIPWVLLGLWDLSLTVRVRAWALAVSKGGGTDRG